MAEVLLEELWSSAAPMLAAGAPDPVVAPRGPQWSFEVKWDGVRAFARVDPGGGVRVRSRSGADVTARYPTVAGARVGTGLAEAIGPAIVDGECVAFDPDGRPSFPGALRGGRAVRLVCFDVLVWRGRDVRDLPLSERRSLLGEISLAEATGDAWRSSPVFDDGPALLDATREQGLEGVMAKDVRSRYRTGVRSTAWVKLPHLRIAQVVVVGWLVGASGSGIGSLVVADAGRRLVGAVGSGMTQRAAEALAPVLRGIARAEPDPGLLLGGREDWLQSHADRITWVLPALVADVRHLGHTDSGALRQPVLVRMRPDLGPADVVGGLW